MFARKQQQQPRPTAPARIAAVALVEAGAPSRFDLTSDPEGIDWRAVYHHVGLAASAAIEAQAELQNAESSHLALMGDPRLAPALYAARQLRETVQQLAAAAYTFASEQEQEQQGRGGAA